MNVKRFLYSLLFVSTLTACGTTQVHQLGELAADKVAIIEGLPGYNPLSVITLQIYSIDGKKVTRKTNLFEVQPGQHTVEVICRREQPEFLQRHLSFNLVVKAGHRYKPRINMLEDCAFEFVDKNTGEKYQGKEK